MLHGACDEAPLVSEDNAFGPTVTMEWHCTVSGWYYLGLLQNDPSVYGEDTNYDLSVTVCLSLLASLVLSLTLIPTLSAFRSFLVAVVLSLVLIVVLSYIGSLMVGILLSIVLVLVLSAFDPSSLQDCCSQLLRPGGHAFSALCCRLAGRVVDPWERPSGRPRDQESGTRSQTVRPDS